jgi:hypothetical protein
MCTIQKIEAKGKPKEMQRRCEGDVKEYRRSPEGVLEEYRRSTEGDISLNGTMFSLLEALT